MRLFPLNFRYLSILTISVLLQVPLCNALPPETTPVECTLLRMEYVNIRHIENRRSPSKFWKEGVVLLLHEKGTPFKPDSGLATTLSSFASTKVREESAPFSGMEGQFLMKSGSEAFVVTVWSWENYVTFAKAYKFIDGIWQAGLDQYGEIGDSNDQAVSDAAKTILRELRQQHAEQGTIVGDKDAPATRDKNADQRTDDNSPTDSRRTVPCHPPQDPLSPP